MIKRFAAIALAIVVSCTNMPVGVMALEEEPAAEENESVVSDADSGLQSDSDQQSEFDQDTDADAEFEDEAVSSVEETPSFEDLGEESGAVAENMEEAGLSEEYTGEMSAESGSAEETVYFDVDSTYAVPGSDVDVQVSVKNNLGILGATLKLNYSESLSLIEAEGGEAFGYLTFQKPGHFGSPCTFSWDGQSISEGETKDGVILDLKFRVSENAVPGEKLDIGLTAGKSDILDNDLKALKTEISNGHVLVLSYTPGDVNDDGKINSADLVLMRRYIVGGYGVSINEKAADVNNDLLINAADVITIRRFIAGGYGVKLKPVTRKRCEHEKVRHAKVEATCTKDGNEEYWYCEVCDKYFLDED